ncbi:hypothetical protein Mal4_32760 [Maioricimonas rarisocia]|uniref:Zinc-ribbon domain-containing protein n=1 Tax=Maioricimonas rarisocia TaxID=2528026 RepID=A0A517Z8Y8_9PLAN|nr:hypothetical protein [Maioricimonas rarisocia]QDU38944.1 hypothetical protein Mal4_32760 [Maioricimonas rarisocia]
MVSWFALILAVGVVGLIVLIVVVLSKGLRLPGMGHATLACPHCGKETRAGRPSCEHCGQDV